MGEDGTATGRPADVFLVSFLRPADDPLQAAGPPSEPEEIVERARYHGLETLLAEDERFARAAPAAYEALRRIAAGQAIRETLHLALLQELCTALAAAGIDFIFLKGTALAYLVYDRPHHRPRCDSDIFVPADQVRLAAAVLESLGLETREIFAPHNQSPFSTDRHGVTFEIDLHWRAANSEVVSRAHEFAVVSEGQQPLPRLHPSAFAPASAHLLSFAIVHLRFERQYLEGDRLIWLLDLERIAERMVPADWERFTDHLRRIGLSGAAAATLARAETLLGPFIPDGVRQRLAADPAGKLTAYLGASEFGRMRRELLCRPPGHAGRYLRQIVLPPRERLEEIYGYAPLWRLPALYARRAIGGIAKARDRS